jgi:geranylgeranyl diphosphate synthase type II
LKSHVEQVDDYIHSYFAAMDLPEGAPVTELKEAMLYSAGVGGKRFRPVLALIVGELFSAGPKAILPFATAVELIHTYSLIHDDLPCMDNDELRRGKLTNHKVYGETTALLAGDALLTEAFLLVASEYHDQDRLASRLVELLSRAAGIRGMVGGQAIDLKAKDFSVADLTNLHHLKTGRLIQVAAEGAAVIAGASPKEIESIAAFGGHLGLAFQIADDILDQNDKDQGSRSFVTLLGIQGAKAFLQKVSAEAIQQLHQVAGRSGPLEQMIEFNQTRQK